MTYNVITTPRFKKDAKKLLKKYPSLHKELLTLEQELQINPVQGDSLGNNTYKVRLGIKSKGKGKSGGARVITYLVTSQIEVYLLTIYDKSELSTIDNHTLKSIIKDLNLNKTDTK